MYYQDVFRRLNENNVRYIVVGGIALNLHGIPRMTVDLDLMIDLSHQNLLNFVECIEQLGYKPKLSVKSSELIDPKKRLQWQQQKAMIVFSFYHLQKPYQSVDVFIDNPIDFNEAYKSKKIIYTRNIEIPIISIEHLIVLKRLTGRKQDLADIEALEKVKELLKEK